MTSIKHFALTLPKNTKEEVQVALTEYQRHKCADIRIDFDDGGGKKPTKALCEALWQAEAEAQRLGFLQREAA